MKSWLNTKLSEFSNFQGYDKIFKKISPLQTTLYMAFNNCSEKGEGLVLNTDKLLGNVLIMPMNKGNLREDDDNIPKTERWVFSNGVAHQALIVTAVLLYGACLGATMGYPAILLPQLQANDSTLPTDKDTGSWIASLQSAVSPVGGIAGGIAMDRWGRRFTMRLGLLPLLMGYLVLSVADSHLVVLLGRFVTGLAAGFQAATSTVLLSEVATPRLRGLYASGPYVSFSVGVLLVYALGSQLHWHMVAVVIALLPLLSLIAFVFVPESPAWLVRNNNIEEAEKALLWLRGNGNEKQAKRELDELVSSIHTEKKEDNLESGFCEEETLEPPKHPLRILMSPALLKPFFVAHVYNLFQIFTGTILVVFYAVPMVAQMSEDLDSYAVAQMTAVVRLIFVAVASTFLFVINRRTHAIASGAACAIAAMALAVFLYASETVESLSQQVKMWVTIGLILAFIAANTCGFLSLPSVLAAELVPVKIRGVAGGYIFAANDLTQFAAAKLYPCLEDAMGAHGVFFLFGINAMICTIFALLFLPETQGKSLVQIEEYFRGNNFLWFTREKNPIYDGTRIKYIEMKQTGKETYTAKTACHEENEQKSLNTTICSVNA